MTRIYLTAIGISYVMLAVWCSAAPESTSAFVGFTLREGQGQSEYLTVYGGLQLALGCVFLYPLYRREATRYCLGVCLAVFSALVVFRTIGFGRYSGFDNATYMLAGTEWLFLVLGILVWIRDRRS